RDGTAARVRALPGFLQPTETSVRDPWVPPSSMKDPEQGLQRIVEPVNDALLKRNDRVVGNGDVFGTHLGTTLRDVAQSDALRFFQLGQPVFRIQRVHLQRGRVDEQTRPDKLVLKMMFAKHVTH